MKTRFRNVHLSKPNLERLGIINRIIEEYQAEGYTLTLRQLYYQLVSRDIVPNKQAEYAKLSNLLKEGRMSGIVDWNAIEDRTRGAKTPNSWDNPAQIVDAVIQQYQVPRLEGQDTYLEVWVEKDALSGVLSRVTTKYHVPIMVNRGYSSVSAMHESYLRFKKAITNKQRITLLYLGDYDPSGIDMIRDVNDRIVEFLTGCDEVENYYSDQCFEDESGEQNEFYYELEKAYGDTALDEDGYYDNKKAFLLHHFQVIPIALTIEQIRQYNPPPNPAKVTDPRAAKFIAELGKTSWEVDALRPDVLNTLLTEAIESRLDMDTYDKQLKRENVDKAKLRQLKKQL